MEKRRHDKRHRKMVKRKKLMIHRSPAQITSPHQLEKLLKKSIYLFVQKKPFGLDRKPFLAVTKMVKS